VTVSIDVPDSAVEVAFKAGELEEVVMLELVLLV
jgi:hypothetical protein